MILDEVFLRGAAAQTELSTIFAGLDVLWVGVRCDPDVAAAREAQRDDRVPGMARDQADRVHAGVRYDVELDTTHTTAAAAADVIVDHLQTG